MAPRVLLGEELSESGIKRNTAMVGRTLTPMAVFRRVHLDSRCTDQFILNIKGDKKSSLKLF